MRKIISAVVAVVAAFGLGLAVPAGASTATIATTLHYTSHSAGYAALLKSGSTVTSFKYGSANFTLPSLFCNQVTTGEVSHFVAFGNSSGQPSDGIGVSEFCSNSATSYSLVELICGVQHVVSFQYPLNPGDNDNLTVEYPYNNGILLAYGDSTIGVGFADTAGNCLSKADRSSAGVFTYGDIGGQGTADFVQIGFRQIQVGASTSKSSAHPLVYPAWNVGEYALKGPSGQVDVKPEALLSGTFTSAFANDWLNSN